MDIHPIRTEADYDRALAEVEQYFVQVSQLGTEEADRFDVLSSLIEAYEAKAWPIKAPEATDVSMLEKLRDDRDRAGRLRDRVLACRGL